MLDPYESSVFDGMVARLRVDDPAFCRQLDRMGRPRDRMRIALAVALWFVAPVCIVVGGWTGLLMAVVAMGYGTRLLTRRTPVGSQPLWWTATRGRSRHRLA